MSTRFENDKDLDRELNAIKIFCEKFKAKYKKLGKYDVDYKVTRGDSVCHIEFKGRNRYIADAYPLPIAARKLVKLCDKKTEGIIIWGCLDGLIYGNIKHIESIGKIGGRKPREGAANDVEYMLYFNKQDMLLEIL